MTIFVSSKSLLGGLVIAGASLAAFAQTSVAPPTGTTQTPAAVGVSPQTAADANRQTVPRNDTATVVRTSPDAVDSARSAASAAGGAASNMGTGTTMRPAKADRN